MRKKRAKKKAVVLSLEQQQTRIVSSLVAVQKISKCLETLSWDALPPNRAYCSLDLIEAVHLVDKIVSKRLETADKITIWDGDPERGYNCLFNSIEAETKDAISVNFPPIGTNRLGPYFVSTFNQLFVDHVLKILRLVGPTEAKALLSTTLNAAIRSMNDESTSMSIMEAKNLLGDFRAEHQKSKKSTKSA